MSEEIGQFIEAMIEKYGLWKVITAPFVVVPILASFGLVVNASTASFLAITFAFFVSFILTAVFGMRLRTERRNRQEGERTIMRLTETVIAEEVGTTYRWETWSQHVVVSKGGDTTVEDWRTLRVNDNAQLRVVWAGLEKTGGPLMPQQRRSVRVEAYDFTEAGGRREIGIRYDLAKVWHDRDQALVVYLCFDRALDAGKVVNVYLVWRWPGYYRELVAGGQDKVFFESKRGSVRKIELEMTFDKTCGLKDEMRIQAYPGCPVPNRLFRGDGSMTLNVTYGPDHIPLSAGFTLDNQSRLSGS
jgi:hypothetical protein